MSKEEVISKIHAWVRNFVSVPNEKLNGHSPCPFALESLIKGKVLILVNENEDQEETKSLISQAAEKIIASKFEVAVIAHTQYSTWPNDNVTEYVKKWREDYREKDLYLLKDHPENKEIVSQVRMNQGDYLLFFVQQSSLLLKARRQLAKNGYYENWSSEERDRVFGSLKLEEELVSDEES